MQDGPILVTPAAELVEMDLFRRHAMIDSNVDDQLLVMYLSAATDYVQRRVGQQFMPATYLETWDHFPGRGNNYYPQSPGSPAYGFIGAWGYDHWGHEPHERHREHRGDKITLSRRPVQSITSVQYYDQTGTLQTLDPALWQADLNSRPVRIQSTWPSPWPITQHHRMGAVLVTYVAGYTSIALVPKSLVIAVMNLAKHSYDNRSVTAGEKYPRTVPYQIDEMIDLYDQTGYQ